MRFYKTLFILILLSYTVIVLSDQKSILVHSLVAADWTNMHNCIIVFKMPDNGEDVIDEIGFEEQSALFNIGKTKYPDKFIELITIMKNKNIKLVEYYRDDEKIKMQYSNNECIEWYYNKLPVRK